MKGMASVESLTVEYKKSFGKEVIISLVAFANAEGDAVISSLKSMSFRLNRLPIKTVITNGCITAIIC